MAVNRYTQITPSQFNPLSLEEVMLVPSMKRKQHDDTIAKQEGIRQKLAEVDPLDVHNKEAIRLRESMNNKLDAQAQQLASQGVSNNTQGEFLALNREYQNLTGPTGRIGQINNAKKLYDAEKARFLETASKQYGSAQAIKLWGDKTADYSGYDGTEANGIKNIDPQGIVAAQDFQADLKDFHSLLGSTMNEVARGGGNVFYDPEMGGYKTTNSNSSESTKNNIAQLNEMRKVLDNKWRNPTGEGALYNQESGIDINNFNNRFNSAINMQADRASSNKRDSSISFNPDPAGRADKEDVRPTSIFDPASTTTLEDQWKTAKFGLIGELNTGGNKGFTQGSMTQGGTPGSGGLYSNNSSRNTYKDILNPNQQSQFELAFNKMKKSGAIDKNSSIDSLTPTQAKKIGDHITSNIKQYTIGNDIVQADINESADLFMGQFVGKTGNQRNEQLNNDIQARTRKIINPKTKLPFTNDEWDSFKADGGKVEYYGYDNPMNYRGYNFGDKYSQTVMAHKGTLIDGDGVSLGLTEISRTPQELGASQFKASYNITHTYRNAVENVGKWVNAATSGGSEHQKGKGGPINSIKGLKMMFNEDGSISLKKGESIMKNLPLKQAESILYDLQLNFDKK